MTNTKLRELIEEIVDDCTGGKRVERFQDLRPEQQDPLLAAVVEDNIDAEWCFYDDLTDAKVRECLALMLRDKDDSASAALLFKSEFRRLMCKSAVNYINQVFEKVRDKKDWEQIQAEQERGYFRTTWQQEERQYFDKHCR